MMAAPLREVTEDNVGNTLRVPPQSYEAERALLGAIFLNNRAYERVSEFLKPHHFASEANARIYAAAQAIFERGGSVSPVTLAPVMASDDVLQAAGGMKYLGTIAGSAVTIINAKEYGQLLLDLHIRRELIGIGEDIVNDAFDAKPDAPAMASVEDAQEKLHALEHFGESERSMVSFDEAADRAIALAERAHKADGRLIGVTTGIVDLDRKLGGLQATDLIILAARPSMGKTALALTMAHNAAQYFMTTDQPQWRGREVVFMSLEMAAERLTTRILSHHANVSSFAVSAGRLSHADFEQFVVRRGNTFGLPLWIDDSPNATVARIRSRCRRSARQRTEAGESKLGLIVIDYLQLISPGTKNGGRFENRVNELSEITRGLKSLAMELRVPVVALSQLSRAVESREDKRPMLSDLRESGSIEQDSDVVMFVYREQYYLERNEPHQRAEESAERWLTRQAQWETQCQAASGIMEVIVAKQRHGPIGTERLHFESATTWVTDIVKTPEQAELL